MLFSVCQHICDYGKQSKNVVLAFYSLCKCVGCFSSSNSYNTPRILTFPVWGGRIGISGCRSLSNSVVCIWFELVMVKNPRFAVGISKYISTSSLGGHISISGCWTHLGTLSLNSPWSKTPDWLLESNIFVVLILKHLGAFLPPSATGVHKNRSAI